MSEWFSAKHCQAKLAKETIALFPMKGEDSQGNMSVPYLPEQKYPRKSERDLAGRGRD